MRDLPWAEMPFFLSLARTGTFSAASVELGKDRTTISRRLTRIETHLGRQLFDRTDVGLVMTSYGRRVLEIAELAEQEMGALVGAGDHDFAQQTVRIAISEHLLSAIAEDMAGFLQAQPEYLLDFVTGDAHADLEHFEADIAVRLSGRVERGLHAIPAGRPTFSLFALRGRDPQSAGYIARPGEHEPPQEIVQQFPAMSVRARANGVHATLHLVRAGWGCAILPDYIGFQEPALQRIEVRGFDQTGQINVVCREEQRRLQRIRTTTKALAAAMANAAGIGPVG